MRAIRSERLVLEPVTEHNAAGLWRIMQSAHLRQFQDVPRIARDEFVRRVARRPKSFDGRAIGRFEWLIVVRRTKAAIGWVSMRVTDNRGGVTEIGYSVLAPARQKGYATEAVGAMVDAAFADTDVTQVDACCVPENAPSRRLLEALGFRQSALQTNGAVVRGRPVDVCVYAVTRTQWRAAQSSSANSIVIPASSNP